MTRTFRSLPLALLLLTGCNAPVEDEAGLLFDDVTVIDGSGGEPYVADVAVHNGRIVTIESAPGVATTADGVRRVDARGLVLAPGFIDLHSHADLILLAEPGQRNPLVEAKMRQGVTTWIVGNCGLGVAPTDATSAITLAAINGWMTPVGVTAGAQTISSYLDTLEARQLPMNVGMLLPHGPLRISVMGLRSGPPDEAELTAMRRGIRKGLQAGAFGVSNGLIYPPGMYSAPAELQTLATEVALQNGLWTTHVRGSSETLLAATDELIELARVSGVRVHHSHLEAVGRRFWPAIHEVLEREDRARAEGLEISHDVFLYTRAATMMAAIFPPWALEGGLQGLLDRLGDTKTRQRIADEIEQRVPEWPPWVQGGWPHNLVEAVGWEGIFVASLAANVDDPRIGRTLADLAAEQDRHPFEVVADLMLEFDGRVGQWVGQISGDGNDREALRSILWHPAAAIVSDAEDYGSGLPHPAHAGAFTRALRWSRQGLAPALPETIRKMTGYPAELLGLTDRGGIRKGMIADLVLFDPATVGDEAEWLSPRRHSTGIRMVLVAGQPVIDAGQFTPGSNGQILRRSR